MSRQTLLSTKARFRTEVDQKRQKYFAIQFSGSLPAQGLFRGREGVNPTIGLNSSGWAL
jgi:hypothetical protein